MNVVYKFGRGINTGMFDANIVGGKGAKLAEMGSLGLPVPPGVTITTHQCNQYLNAESTLTQEALIANIVDGTLYNLKSIEQIEELGYLPLVSVRSGARVSMPGMMDTILNVGINDANLPTWEERLGVEAAHDCYIRFIKMYGEVVMGIPAIAFVEDIDESHENGVDFVKRIYEELTGNLPPQTIEDQLTGCIKAVFLSWHSERAVAYRAIHGYPDDWGTAVTVQQMVFGNRNDKSATGVMFTRDFNTGEQNAIIDWLPNAQGEDIVAGTHDTKTTNELDGWNSHVAKRLKKIGSKVEVYYRDMQDIEFTIDDGELFILQTRDGKRSALAAFKIAWDLHMAGTISAKEALARVTGKQYIALQNPTINPTFTDAPDFEGIGAAGSIVTGIVVRTSKDAVSCTEDCILVTKETTPKDFPGMAASVGILTKTGGITSHAAVVARGMDKTCVVGAESIKFAGPDKLEAGTRITINGETGEIWVDKKVPVVVGQIPAFVEEMIGWADYIDTQFLSVLPESIPAGTVYVDVSGTLDTIKSLTTALTAAKGSKAKGLLGFGRNDAIEKVDSEFMGFFGISGQSYDDGTYAVIREVLIQPKWTKKFKRDWTLHLPGGTDELLIVILRQHGWNIVTVVNSFKAALSVDGYVVMDEGFQQRLIEEDLTFSVIEELVTKAGAEVTELPDRVTKKRQMFDVLGG